MAALSSPAPDVFSAAEVARAAGVPVSAVRAAIAGANLRSHRGFLSARHAIRAVRLLREQAGPATRDLFEPPVTRKRSAAVPLAVSGSLHLAIALGLTLLATIGVSSRPVVERMEKSARLVFLALSGPGGGGGGGGLKQRVPAPKAERKGRSPLRSPVSVQRAVRKPEVKPAVKQAALPPPVPQPAEQPVEPPPPPATPEPTPPVQAPVASVPADERDRPGVIADAPSDSESRGTGSGGGTGSGQGTGVGEGTGSGIGPGSGGGIGGGPYRPGSGVTPPRILREVKPDYTDEARRRGLEGDVVLEIIVRSDGRVGSVRVLQGLGGGLDQRAAEAVRQWRFAPAERLGRPVDVVVEVAVEFRLR